MNYEEEKEEEWRQRRRSRSTEKADMSMRSNRSKYINRRNRSRVWAWNRRERYECGLNQNCKDLKDRRTTVLYKSWKWLYKYL